jgi:hypothetical protein
MWPVWDGQSQKDIMSRIKAEFCMKDKRFPLVDHDRERRLCRSMCENPVTGHFKSQISVINRTHVRISKGADRLHSLSDQGWRITCMSGPLDTNKTPSGRSGNHNREDEKNNSSQLSITIMNP